MPRVPFVGRLHLYLPPFRQRTSEEFTTPEESPTGSDFTPKAHDVDPGQSSEGGSQAPAYSSELEHERLYYKFRVEGEREKAERLNKSRWTVRWFQDEANTFLSSSVPIWRRNSQEYVALVVSFCFLILESFVRVITVALPTPVIHFFYRRSRTLFNALSPASHTTKSSTPKEKSIVSKIREAESFVDLCAIWGYEAEEHIVQTKDGYLLGLHRVRPKGSAEKRARERAKGRGRGRPFQADAGKRVVYMHHGLMMNSEVWVCHTEKERCLAFILVDSGYDVWLGNNRGNKYSKKSIHHSSSTSNFWDFSMDQFAIHDIPDAIAYILDTTRSKSLSYIGFSQGTAQAFASLSIHPSLNEQVDVFIALAPAMSPAGLHNPIVDAFIKASPSVLYLLFGRKSMLSSTTFWQSILYPPIFVRIIDSALSFLFNWQNVNITLNQKLAAYSHLYSYTSTKSIVHWFQIIRNQSFQMYDDDVQAQSMMNMFGNTFYRVARFPTKNITTPIVLVWGGSDSLVDIRVMLKELPGHTIDIGIPHYEHLDMLWAQDVDRLVFPTILESLETYSYSCEGEDDDGDSDSLKHHSYTHSRACKRTNPIARGGRAGQSRSGPSNTNTEAPMDDVDGAPGSTSSVAPPSRSEQRNCNIDNRIDPEASLGHSELRETTHGIVRRPCSSSLEATEEPPPHATLQKLDQPTEQLEDPLATPKARPRPAIDKPPPLGRPHSPLHHRQVSLEDPTSQPPPTVNPFKEFFINPGLFTRKLRARSNSISSAASSNASASGGASIKSSGNTSDEGGGGRGGKIFVPGGIVLARAGAAVGVSTDSTAVEELEDAEQRRRRQRQRRLRRETASS